MGRFVVCEEHLAWCLVVSLLDCYRCRYFDVYDGIIGECAAIDYYLRFLAWFVRVYGSHYIQLAPGDQHEAYFSSQALTR